MSLLAETEGTLALAADYNDTLPFNGYPEVAELYAGMDPVVYF